MATILVVDDSTTMRRMIAGALRELSDVTFEQAATGLEAIEQLALSPVDLVILDLNMPDVHGFEVLRFIRSHDTFRNLPVLVLTTRSDEDAREGAFREGATAFLTKPFTPGTLAPEVRRLLTTVRVT